MFERENRQGGMDDCLLNTSQQYQLGQTQAGDFGMCSSTTKPSSTDYPCIVGNLNQADILALSYQNGQLIGFE